jgi:hypothetical protein
MLRMALACLVLTGAASAASQPGQAAQESTPQQVQLAVDRLRVDPNLPRAETTKTLRFKSFENKPTRADDSERESNMEWLLNLVEAVAGGARVVVWVLGALAVALVVVCARRWIKVQAGGGRHHVGPPPSHVGSLDIRPESFPPHIGAAAEALWRQGQQRAALSLLYRGALSRAVHLHAVPIRGASTEGEALALASGRLAPAPLALFARLVSAWQLAAYGGRLPDAVMAQALCDDFDLCFGPAAPAEGAAA